MVRKESIGGEWDEGLFGEKGEEAIDFWQRGGHNANELREGGFEQQYCQQAIIESYQFQRLNYDTVPFQQFLYYHRYLKTLQFQNQPSIRPSIYQWSHQYIKLC